jgi:hypothetical protein
MTPDAKKLLSSTIRALHGRLLGDLRAAMETEYRLGVPRLRDAGLGEATARKRARLEDWLDEQVSSLSQDTRCAKLRVSERTDHVRGAWSPASRNSSTTRSSGEASCRSVERPQRCRATRGLPGRQRRPAERSRAVPVGVARS